jgi:hypothetical protein
VHLRRRSLDGCSRLLRSSAWQWCFCHTKMRSSVLRTGFCSTFAYAKAWYKVFYDLGIGALVSLAFYYIVVRLPEYQRRQRLKRSLELHYRAFRLNCIEIMLAVADGGYTGGQAEALLDPEEFKKYFKQKVTPDKERWHEFMNNLNEFYLVRLQTLMEQLRDELMFVLNNTDIPKDEPFEFLKRLSAAM